MKIDFKKYYVEPYSLGNILGLENKIYKLFPNEKIISEKLLNNTENNLYFCLDEYQSNIIETHKILLNDKKSAIHRELIFEIDFSYRFIAIKGSRGVGKTTFLLDIIFNFWAKVWLMKNIKSVIVVSIFTICITFNFLCLTLLHQ